MSTNELKLNLNLSLYLTRSIENELADHIACAKETAESAPSFTDDSNTAGDIRKRLSLASTLRKLSSPHIVDQVSHTLWRKPTRAEWREFGWLLFWFALVYVSDLIAVNRLFPPEKAIHNVFLAKTPLSSELALKTIHAWLLSAFARSGFFIQFFVTFARSFRMGIGVFVARLIQIKLIHTLFVLLGYGSMYPYWQERWDRTAIWEWRQGAMLNVVVIIYLLAITFVLLILIQILKYSLNRPGPRLERVFNVTSIVLSFMALTLLFLYQGAPQDVTARNLTYYVYTEYKQSENTDTQIFTIDYYPMRTLNERLPLDPVLTIKNKVVLKEEFIDKWSTVPYIKSGAGLGWLSLPIPILAVLSLFSMWWVLGRRSRTDMVIYGSLVIVALYGTLSPFFYMPAASNFPPVSEIIIGAPFRCYDSSMRSIFLYQFYENQISSYLNRTLMSLGISFAFLFSALIPWLMVGLFARTKAKKDRVTVAPG